MTVESVNLTVSSASGEDEIAELTILFQVPETRASTKISSGIIMADDMKVTHTNKRATFSKSSSQWSQWQLLDSILPTGGFAHSFGLEAAMGTRVVEKPEDLQTFVIHVLENTGSQLLPFVYSACTSPNAENLHNLNKMLDAMLTNEVGRKASVSQGSALMRVAAAAFADFPYLKSTREKFLGSGAVSFHHAPVFGLVCGVLGFDSEMSQRAYVFITMRDIISAATRLNLVGPLGAAVLQHNLADIAEEIVQKWKDRRADEACQTVPLLDAVQGCHSYLFSRLFCS